MTTGYSNSDTTAITFAVTWKILRNRKMTRDITIYQSFTEGIAAFRTPKCYALIRLLRLNVLS